MKEIYSRLQLQPRIQEPLQRRLAAVVLKLMYSEEGTPAAVPRMGDRAPPKGRPGALAGPPWRIEHSCMLDKWTAEVV